MFSGYQGNHMVQNDWGEGKLEDGEPADWETLRTVIRKVFYTR